MEGHYLNISESLSLIGMQEKESHNTSLKDHMTSLKLGLLFLKMFLGYSNNEDLKRRITYVVYTVCEKLHSLSKRPNNESLIRYLSSGYSDLCDKMKNVIFNPQTREYDDIFQEILESKRYFKKINDSLLEIFGNLSSCNGDRIACLTKESEDIKEKLVLLKPLLTYVADRKVHITEENKKLLAPLVAVLDKAACLFFSCLFDKMDEQTKVAMKRKLSDLYMKINVKEIYMVVLRASNFSESKKNPLGSEFYLLENQIWLLDCNIDLLNDPSSELHKKLKILKSFLDQKIEKCNYLVASIEDITCSAIPILYSCYDKNMKEDMVREVNGALAEVLVQIEHIDAGVSEIKLNSYPKTDELGFLDLLLGCFEELLQYRPELIQTLRSLLETLHEEFDFLRSLLRRIKQQRNDHQELEDHWTHIIGLAYQAEYVVDLYLVKNAPDSCVMFSLSKIVDQIMVAKPEVIRICNEEKNCSNFFDISETSKCVASHDTDPTTTEVVGFEDEAEKIMEFLIGDTSQLEIISIVGMPGLGKTTLARKIYGTSAIIEHFDIQSWYCVSQRYHMRELFLTILSDIYEGTREITKLDGEELAEMLYKYLKGRRYLIVIDDLWHYEAWNYLSRSFPDDHNGSRILITSRIQNMAFIGSKVHTLREFSEEESWELFQKKLFPEERISYDLVEVGKQIVHSCKGLPLGIVVVAGVLAKMEKSVDKWKLIAENVNSRILSDSCSCSMDILKLSYDFLPNHLRSCFLYTGTFLEDKEVPSWKLKWLWIAEGFVQNSAEKSLEDVAEEYLEDLISNSLIIATKERSHGGAKAFRVHDLLRGFCIEKAKEENFLQVIHVETDFRFSKVYDQRRLRIYSVLDDVLKANPSGSSVRTLLHTASEYISDMDVSFIFQNFKLLRVLDFACINMSEYFTGMELLIHLKYLAFAAQINFIPRSIANLWNLEFLLVKANSRYGSKVVDVPDSLWDMMKLRHVQINHGASFNVQNNRLERSSLLENLETLSTPCLSYGEDAENLLRRLPKLRKLSYIFLDNQDDKDEACKYPVLEFLYKLVSLKVNFCKSLRRPTKCEFNFPTNLQKLTLLNFEIPWNDISKIGLLPNLKVLKLIGKGSYGNWIVNDGEFLKLTYLKLKYLRFDKWIASEDSFPILEQLVLDDCSNLDEIPPCFGEYPALRMIIVRNCEPSVDDSARRIEMEQKEWQNEELKVYIYPNKRCTEDI